LLVVVAHGTLAREVSKVAGASARIIAIIRIALSVVDKAVHLDRASLVEIVAVDVTIARQPIGTLIVDAGALELEERIIGAGIVRIAGGELVVNAVNFIVNAIIADVPILAIGFAIRVQHAEVIIKGMVLLQHEDDVVNRLNTAYRVHG
jgi:hypothetical protein